MSFKDESSRSENTFEFEIYLESNLDSRHKHFYQRALVMQQNIIPVLYHISYIP